MKNPDVVVNPTKDNFIAQLKQLAADGYYIDIFIYTHGNRNQFSLEGGAINAATITAELGKVYGSGKFPIRMVYMMNCWGSTLNNGFQASRCESQHGGAICQFFSQVVSVLLARIGRTVKM